MFEWAAKNSYAGERLLESSEDYVAARCLILNGFPRCGFILGCQAVEKILKAIIFLETGERITKDTKDKKRKKGWKHEPFELKEKLTEKVDYGLEIYNDILISLGDCYKSRYFENSTSGKGANSRDLEKMDKLYIYLMEKIKIPDEAKYRGSFFTDLFESNKYWAHHPYWLKIKNKALTKKKLEKMERKYKKILKHFYPSKC